MQLATLPTGDSTPALRLLSRALLAAFAVLCVLHVWVVDDAYITLRYLDQALAGNGLVWNTGERVQGYTHPLWALILLPVYAITREGFWTVSAFSFAVTLTGVVLAVRAVERRGGQRAGIALLLLLVPSKAFLDYTSSGLENPLSHLVLFAFYAVFFGAAGEATQQPGSAWARDARRAGPLLPLGLLASAACLTRADLVCFVAPALAWSAWPALREAPRRTVRVLAAGGAPVVIWSLWALFYYGSMVPNTAIAKLVGARVTAVERLRAGGLYFVDSILRDPYSLSLAAFAVIALSTRRGRGRVAALGLGCYLAYVLAFGAAGTHMSGRFLSGVVGLSALAIAWHGDWPRRVPLPVLGAASLLLGIAMPASPLRAAWNPLANPSGATVHHGVIDTRFFATREGAALRSPQLSRHMPNHAWYHEGTRFRAQPAAWHVGGAQGLDPIGYFGYAAGPRTSIVDPLGLTDPLLARIPLSRHASLDRPGHVRRNLPAGYLDGLMRGENGIADPDLRQYCGVIQQITRGPLWSLQRARLIVEFNLGRYELFLDGYARRWDLRPR